MKRLTNFMGKYNILREWIFVITFSILGLMEAAAISRYETERRYLSGIDKDTNIEWEFMCSSGRKSGNWTKIKVPSCWETQGFGNYYYGWEEPYGSDEIGYYRHKFRVDASWKKSNVEIVFEGSMTDTEVKVNGILAGDIHEGGFYQFRYDITDLLKYGKENTIEVKVKKCPSDSSIYRAERQTDFWLFGGIYRPVYLERKPDVHIKSIAVDARHDGTLRVKPYIRGNVRNKELLIYVETLDGVRLSGPIRCPADETISTKVENVTAWSHENPQLYKIVAELYDNGKLKHRVTDKIGFRTIEFKRGNGFYLNGKRLIFKGVNRHCFWPESGRTLSRQISLEDAMLIKEMNMNAVRMSHYPPDTDFLEICDSIGLLVIDELCGWQKKYDTAPAKRLAKSMIERDRNHPSVVMWANGNEGGWNSGIDGEYGKYDLQDRLVIHPWERFNGIDTKHYPDYNYMVNSSIYDHDVYLPTEFMHSIGDGGGASSLKDFWNVAMNRRAPAGGFIWALLDEGLVRTDKDGDIDCRGDRAPDGILGPFREKEGSFYAIKELWSPVKIVNRIIPDGNNFTLLVENHYTFNDLSDCGFRYELVDVTRNQDGSFSEKIVCCDTITSPQCAPGERRQLSMHLPDSCLDCDILRIKIASPRNENVYSYSWPLGTSDRLQCRLLENDRPNEITVLEEKDILTVTHGAYLYVFDRHSGGLNSIVTSHGKISLSGVPKVVTSNNECSGLASYWVGDTYIVEPKYVDGHSSKWVFTTDMPVKIDYSFTVKGEAAFIGLGFDYPEQNVLSMDWVGGGPYRVWKNRMEGVTFGCHHKDYNNTITGESWLYPEFKGCHADCRAVTVNTTEGKITFIPSRKGLFFQMLQPGIPQNDGNGFTMTEFPDTSLGFMYAIPPVGTKFQKPEQMGPSGQKNMQLNYTPYSGSIWIIPS